MPEYIARGAILATGRPARYQGRGTFNTVQSWRGKFFKGQRELLHIALALGEDADREERGQHH